MIGLGVMGRNFLLNVAESGFSCVGYDLDAEKRKSLDDEAMDFEIGAADSLEDFIAKLETPRKIMMLVPAGKIVDGVIENLLPHLEKGDIIIDGGNSHFTDTEKRQEYLAEKGFAFLGVGVSGGAEGARHGASIMPGGDKEAYEKVADILIAASAKVNGEPCVTYIGKGSSGHFVKMVHNGIEYGLMEILSETYDFMKRVLKMDYDEMSKTFAEWNDAELNSYLVEITSKILTKKDSKTDKPLVEMILDKAAQKGTGKWTSQVALDFGVPIPTIDSAVTMRQISAQKEVRILTAQKYGNEESEITNPPTKNAEKVESQLLNDEAKAVREAAAAETIVTEQQDLNIEAELSDGGNDDKHSTKKTDEKHDETVRENVYEDKEEFIEKLKQTLFSSFIVTYAQGMSLLQVASIEKDYELNLAEIAKIWRGGCIIRSQLLEDIRNAYSKNSDLANMVMDDDFADILSKNRDFWCQINNEFAISQVPSLGLASALSYFDAFRSHRLPANMIQAQRDFFGSHTYQRIDEEGIFHTEWETK